MGLHAAQNRAGKPTAMRNRVQSVRDQTASWPCERPSELDAVHGLTATLAAAPLAARTLIIAALSALVVAAWQTLDLLGRQDLAKLLDGLVHLLTALATRSRERALLRPAT